MKAPVAYYGGKSGLAKVIVGLLPPHRVYLEPFFGSGAVLFAKKPATHEIVNDLDHAVVAFFKCLRDRPEELEAVVSLCPHARDEFDAAAAIHDAGPDIELARLWWVRVNQSFGKTAGRQTGFSVTTARSQAIPASVAGRIRRFEHCARRLMGVTIESCDGIGLIERLATDDTAIYVDPPYDPDARRSRRAGNAAADYRVDMSDHEDHRRLSKVLHETDAAVLLSGYHSPLYDELYADWDFNEYEVNLHSSNAVTSGRGKRVEVIWSNRPLEYQHVQLAFDDPDDEA